MITHIKYAFLMLCYGFISIPVGNVLAQDSSALEKARQLNKQEIIDLVANKTISYRVSVGSRTAGPANVEMMKITFKKTEESGGTLSAYGPRSSGDGQWHVTDNARLVRQYDNVRWGNKPFPVGVFENNGKYFWKIGEEFQELLSIE